MLDLPHGLPTVDADREFVAPAMKFQIEGPAGFEQIRFLPDDLVLDSGRHLV